MKTYLLLKLYKQYKALLAKVDNLSAKFDQFLSMGNAMTHELQALVDQVKANTDAEQSAIVLIQGLADKIAASADDPAVVAGLANQLKTSADALAAAVVANTPTPPPAPPVVP